MTTHRSKERERYAPPPVASDNLPVTVLRRVDTPANANLPAVQGRAAPRPDLQRGGYPAPAERQPTRAYRQEQPEAPRAQPPAVRPASPRATPRTETVAQPARVQPQPRHQSAPPRRTRSEVLGYHHDSRSTSLSSMTMTDERTVTPAPVISRYDDVADYRPASYQIMSHGATVNELVDYILAPYAGITPTDRRSSTILENAERLRTCRAKLTKLLCEYSDNISACMSSGDETMAQVYRESMDSLVKQRRESAESLVASYNGSEQQYLDATRWNPVAFVLDKMQGRR
jgi:hypothetical protein